LIHSSRVRKRDGVETPRVRTLVQKRVVQERIKHIRARLPSIPPSLPLPLLLSGGRPQDHIQHNRRRRDHHRTDVHRRDMKTLLLPPVLLLLLLLLL
jgi:hypothetical protein